MMSNLKPGLYVMCYHDVRWSEPLHLRGLGICIPPDRFYEHLEFYAAAGEVVDINEGLNSLAGNGPTHPLFVLTFDDGYRGVLDHVAPAMHDLDKTGLLALNHDFISGASVFWRAQLCWILNRGGLDSLAERLVEVGYKSGSIRDFTMDNFCERVLDLIATTYAELDGPDRDRDMTKLHLTNAEAVELQAAGWEIANHSARHLPLLESSASHAIEKEFDLCELGLEEVLGAPTSYWVAPFDRPLNRSREAVTRFRTHAKGRRVMLVGDRTTSADDLADKVIYRVFAPACGTQDLSRRLHRAARRSQSSPPHLEGHR